MQSHSKGSKRPYVMAMALGALTALGSVGAVQAAETTGRAVADMGRYCTTCWRNAHLPIDAWGDCTQEVFSRMLERVPTAAWTLVLQDEGAERREFLRAIDAVKKRTQRARKWSASLDGVADQRELHSRSVDAKRAAVFEIAEEVLTARQQQILRMSCEGWSVQETADELKMSPARVSDEKYKAVQKLRAHLATEES
ncbi:MAG TPA: sigma-70 family RNA polymerase sigma factor [Gemmataceae bacterium]|nr:sigma-70 family RNA polymerase sigma factor [Gemmataceae bacterium]